MKPALLGLAVVTVITAVVFSFLIWVSIRSLQPQQVPPEAALGKLVWQRQGCVECHAILGNGGYSAPDLTHTMKTRGSVWLEDYMQASAVMRPNRQKRHPKVGPEEAKLLVEFFTFLDQIETPGWPPNPIIKGYKGRR